MNPPLPNEVTIEILKVLYSFYIGKPKKQDLEYVEYQEKLDGNQKDSGHELLMMGWLHFLLTQNHQINIGEKLLKDHLFYLWQKHFIQVLFLDDEDGIVAKENFLQHNNSFNHFDFPISISKQGEEYLKNYLTIESQPVANHQFIISDNFLIKELEKKWEVIKVLHGKYIVEDEPVTLHISYKDFVQGNLKSASDMITNLNILQKAKCFKSYKFLNIKELDYKHFIFNGINKKKLIENYNKIQKQYKDSAREYQIIHPSRLQKDLESTEKTKMSDTIQVQTKAGLLIFNTNTGSIKLGKFKAEENLNPHSQEAEVLKKLIAGKDYQATYKEILGEDVSKTKKRNLTFVIRNLKTVLGILPTKNAQNKNCIKNIKQYGYRIIT